MTCSICNDVHSVFSSNNKRIEPCPQCSALATQKPEPFRLTAEEMVYQDSFVLHDEGSAEGFSVIPVSKAVHVAKVYAAQETAEKDKEIARLTKLIQEAEQYFGRTFR